MDESSMHQITKTLELRCTYCYPRVDKFTNQADFDAHRQTHLHADHRKPIAETHQISLNVDVTRGYAAAKFFLKDADNTIVGIKLVTIQAGLLVMPLPTAKSLCQAVLEEDVAEVEQVSAEYAATIAQAQFVQELIGNVRDGILKNIEDGKLPPEWDGIELRELIAQRFKDAAYGMSRSRRRKFNNTCLVNNL